ncbi:MAG: hypothetical protein JF616_00745 [Fibrobacteres bacterium]|nr:hypothetical protein [Fibrobacterota bacterium]
MASLLKSMLAILLGLGFLVLQARAQAPAGTRKAAVAFLGLTDASDPQISEAIAKRIRAELGADPTVNSIPGEEIDKLFSQGILRGPDLRPVDPQALRREVGDAYLAYGSLERIAVDSKRTWWKPWSVKNTWTQGMRLRVVDGVKGSVVFDSLVAAAVHEPGFLFTPEEDWGKVPPLEREKRMRIMAEAVSVVAAKALAKAVKSRPVAASAPGSVPATPG